VKVLEISTILRKDFIGISCFGFDFLVFNIETTMSQTHLWRLHKIVYNKTRKKSQKVFNTELSWLKSLTVAS
jgi:Tfp pilus assembly PilM family ATPase